MPGTKRNYTNAAVLLKVAKQLITDDYYISLLRPGSKINTFDTRTTDSMKEVEAWVEQGGNLGFRPGGRMVVVDIDVGLGGKPSESGERVRAALCGKTFTVKTPSGGWHLYCKKPAERRTSVQHPWFEDVDFLTGNCNVVLPGSYITPDNVEKANGKPGIYTVLQDKPFLDLPSEILTALNKHYRNEQRRTNEEDVDLDRLILAIQELHNEDQDRNYWLKIGMALHAVGEAEGRSDEALTAWVEWSKSRPDGPTVDRDRDMRNLDKAWHSFHRSGDGGHVSGASILWMAREQKEAGQSFEDLSDEDRESVERGNGCDPTHESGAGGVGMADDGRASGMPPADDQSSLFHVEQLPDGWVKELAQFILDAGDLRQPVMAITGALHTVALLSQGRYCISPKRTRLNFCSMVALPSASGKEGAKQAVRLVVPGELQPHIMGGFSHGSGLHNCVAENRNVLWTADEIGYFLQQAAHGKDAISSSLLSVTLQISTAAGGTYSGKAYAKDANSLKPISNPFLSLWGTTTPKGLRDAISAGSQSLLSGGMINRMLPFLTDYVPEMDWFHTKPEMAPMRLGDWAKELAQDAGGSPENPSELELEDGALDVHIAFAKRLHAMPVESREVWGRAVEHSLKICGLLALGSTDRVATVEMAEFSVGLVDECYTRFDIEMAELAGVDTELLRMMDKADRVLKKLRGKNLPKKWNSAEARQMRKEYGAVSVGYLVNAMRMNAKDSREILDHMVEIRRLIAFHGEKVGVGRPTRYLSIAG